MKKILSVTLVLSLLFVGSLVAQAGGLLTEAQQTFFDQKEDQVNTMVEDGRLTVERAEEFLASLELKLSDGTCDQTGEACDGTCVPLFNGEGEGVGTGIQAQAHISDGLGLNGDGECEFDGEGLGTGIQARNGEGSNQNGDGLCDLTGEALGEGLQQRLGSENRVATNTIRNSVNSGK